MSEAIPRIHEALRFLVQHHVLEIVLLLASLAVLALMIERLLTLCLGSKIAPAPLLRVVDQAGRQPELTDEHCNELLRESRNHPSSLANVVGTSMHYRGAPLPALQTATQQTLQAEYDDASRGSSHLLWLGKTGPLLGLLGTVAGIVLALANIGQATTGGQSLLAQGMSTALITTAGGILVAIVAGGAGHFARQRTRALFTRMQTALLPLLPLLARRER
jgi:biopolymer transport protein ExbB